MQAHTIRIPQQQLVLLDTARRLRHELTVASGAAPTLDELADYSAIEASRLRELFTMDNRVTSLQVKIGDTDAEFGDLLTDVGAVDPSDRVADEEEMDALTRAIGDLDDRDRLVLSWHFGLDGERSLAVAEVARRLSVSRHAVDKSLRVSLDHLRSRLQHTLVAS